MFVNIFFVWSIWSWRLATFPYTTSPQPHLTIHALSNLDDLLLFQVGPHEIYVVGRDDDGGSLDDGTASDGASWETVDDNEMDLLDDSAKVFSTAERHYCLLF